MKGVIVWFLLSVCCVLSSYAAEYPSSANSVPVRVGYSDQYGVISGDSEDSFYGYGYEYLQKIAKYTGWTFEFVEGTWEECLDNLTTGKIDVLGPLQYTDERGRIYDFVPWAAGYEYGAVYVKSSNDTIFYDDFQAFDGMRVGAIVDSYHNVAFEEYRKANGFSVEYRYAKSSEELINMLESGEIDALMSGSLLNLEGAKVVARFSVAPFYFAVHKSRPDLLKRFTAAMTRILTENVYYDAELFTKYFKNQSISNIAFTREENDVIAAQPVLRLAYRENWAPVEYRDSVTGEFAGINAGMLELISKHSGIRFEYIPVMDLTEGLSEVARHNADGMCGYLNTPESSAVWGITETSSYLELPLIFVGMSKTAPDKGMSGAVPARYQALTGQLERRYGNPQINIYTNMKDCVEAVRRGTNRVMLISSYMYDELMLDSENREFNVISMTELVFSPSIGLSSSVDPLIVSILNKAISRISSDEENIAIVSNTMGKGNQLSLSRVVREYYLQFIAIVCVLFALIVLVLIYNRRKNEKELKRLAYTDSLTGAMSIEKFRIDAEIMLRKNDSIPYALVYTDIEKFKYINDMFGYDAGNLILRQIAHILKGNLSENELFARVSADNFVVLLKYDTDELLVDRLQRMYRVLHEFSSKKLNYYKLVMNCGICRIMPGEAGIIAIMDKANTARKTIKGGHSSDCAFYDKTIHDRVMREKEIEDSMSSALDDGEFCVYMQPQYRISNDSIGGVEALVRWNSPSKGIIGPDEFIPLFEKNGFVIELDFFVFEQVCRKIRTWLDAGTVTVPVSVNISRIHLRNRDFIDRLQAIVSKYRIPLHLIGLELTETAVQENIHELLDILKQLKDIGFVISMDDFGTGYSSLNLLKELPVDVLKLDKLFFASCSTTDREKIVISNIVRMAKELHIQVVCEGVEKPEQAQFLKSIGCDMIQGYLYARPMPVGEFEELLRISGPANPALRV